MNFNLLQLGKLMKMLLLVFKINEKGCYFRWVLCDARLLATVFWGKGFPHNSILK